MQDSPCLAALLLSAAPQAAHIGLAFTGVAELMETPLTTVGLPQNLLGQCCHLRHTSCRNWDAACHAVTGPRSPASRAALG